MCEAVSGYLSIYVSECFYSSSSNTNNNMAIMRSGHDRQTAATGDECHSIRNKSLRMQTVHISILFQVVSRLKWTFRFELKMEKQPVIKWLAIFFFGVFCGVVIRSLWKLSAPFSEEERRDGWNEGNVDRQMVTSFDGKLAHLAPAVMPTDFQQGNVFI